MATPRIMPVAAKPDFESTARAHGWRPSKDGRFFNNSAWGDNCDDIAERVNTWNFRSWQEICHVFGYPVRLVGAA